MAFKTSKKIRDKFFTKNFKTYSFFLGFTTFLWLALQFSKNYSQEVSFNLKYEQIEPNKLIKPSTDQKIKMVLNGNGFQLLKYSLFEKTINLDTRKASVKNKNHSFFTGKPMINAFRSALEYDGEISFVLKDSLNIYYDVFKEKEIPIKLNSNIKYAQGFLSTNGLESSIKTIMVSGPKSVLDTLKFISTKVFTLSKLKENYKGQLDLETYDEIKGLKYNINKIPITVSVDKLTEEEIKVPITVLNVPKGSKVQLFPKQINVVFSVLLKDHAKISVDDFKIQADLAHASSSNKLLLRLVRFPKNVFNARITEREVQYIVVK